MRAVITVIGKDKVGIIAKISNILADSSVNILDISQTIMQDIFTMVMLVDIGKLSVSFNDLSKELTEAGNKLCLDIRIQNEEIFNSMHRI
jgi:ACT domain-containing protein